MVGVAVPLPFKGFSLQMLDNQHSGASLVTQQPHHYQSQSQSLPHAQIGGPNGANTGGYYNHHPMQQPSMGYGSRQSGGGGNHQYAPASGMTPVGSQVPGQSAQIGLAQQQQPATATAPAAGQYHYQPYQQSYYSTTHMQQAPQHHQSPSAGAGSYIVGYPATGQQGGVFPPGGNGGAAPSQLNGISQNENGLESSSTTVGQQQAGTSPNGMPSSSTLASSSNPMTTSLSSQFVSPAQVSFN